jgi:hypothetical protein
MEKWCGQSRSPAPGWCVTLLVSSPLVAPLLPGCSVAFTMVILHDIFSMPIFGLFIHLQTFALFCFVNITSKVAILVVLPPIHTWLITSFECYWSLEATRVWKCLASLTVSVFINYLGPRITVPRSLRWASCGAVCTSSASAFLVRLLSPECEPQNIAAYDRPERGALA